MKLSETREIDGLPVRVNQLPVLRQGRIAARLVRELGGAFTGAADDASGFAKAAALLLDNQAPSSPLMELLSTVAVEVDGKLKELSDEPSINGALRGRLGTLVEIVGFALEVNFTDFFVKLVSLAKRMSERAEALKPAKTSETSTT